MSPSPVTVQRIVVLGDVFRPQTEVTWTTTWLGRILRTPLREATGLPIEIVTGQSLGLMPAFAHNRKMTPTERDDWIAATLSVPPEWNGGLEAAVAGSLVIGFEMPRSLRRFLDDRTVPYVDVAIHPVRFMPDLMFAMHATFERGEAALADAAIDRSTISAQADVMMAYAATNPAAPAIESGCLFVAQASLDRSMIIDGKWVDYDAVARFIADLKTAGNDSLVVKYHPVERNHQIEAVLNDIADTLPSREITGNIYDLLSDPRIACVASINSSVIEEARFFDKTTRSLHDLPTPVRYRKEKNADGYWSVQHAFRSADFWREALGDLCRTTPPSGEPIAIVPDQLRRSLRIAWGYADFMHEGVTDHVASTLKNDASQHLPRTPKNFMRFVRGRLRP